MEKLTLLFVIALLTLSPLVIAGDGLKMRINNPVNGSVVTEDHVLLDVSTNANAICAYNIGKCSQFQYGGGCGASRYYKMSVTGKTHHLQMIEKLEETVNTPMMQENYFLDVKCVDKLSGDQARARTEFTVDFP